MANCTNSNELEGSREIINTIHITVAIIGIIANSFVLCVVKRKRSMHKAVDFLLVNVAGSDILQLAGSFIYLAMDLQPDFKSHIKWVFYGKILPQVTGFAFCSSTFTLTLLSLQHYHGLVIPMNKKLEINRKNARYVLLLVWIAAIVLQIPLMLYLTYDPSVHVYRLEMSVVGKKIHDAILSLITGCIPITIICVCYSKILYGIYVSKTILSENTTPNGKDQEKRKLVRASLLITVMTILCFVPAEAIFNVAISSKLDRLNLEPLLEVAFVLYDIKGTINPFLYAFQSSNYRRAFKALICHCRKNNTSIRNVPRCAVDMEGSKWSDFSFKKILLCNGINEKIKRKISIFCESGLSFHQHGCSATSVVLN